MDEMYWTDEELEDAAEGREAHEQESPFDTREEANGER